MPLREARASRADSKVASIIRGGEMIAARAATSRSSPATASSSSARRRRRSEWSRSSRRGAGASTTSSSSARGQIGVAVAARAARAGDRRAADRGRPRARARRWRSCCPGARVYHATGLDPDFLERERIGQAQAAVFAMRDDPKNLYAAVLAKLHGVAFTIAIVHDAISMRRLRARRDRRAVNPRAVTAEEIVRFAHDPRTQQVAMLEGDRFEVLDITVRPESELRRQARSASCR